MSKSSPEISMDSLLQRGPYHDPRRVFLAVEKIVGPVGTLSPHYDIASGVLLMAIGGERIVRTVFETTAAPVEAGVGKVIGIIRREIVDKPHSHRGLRTLARDLKQIIGSNTSTP